MHALNNIIFSSLFIKEMLYLVRYYITLTKRWWK